MDIDYQIKHRNALMCKLTQVTEELINTFGQAAILVEIVNSVSVYCTPACTSSVLLYICPVHSSQI